MDYVFKTAPMWHQAQIFEASKNRRACGYFCEQGTGKSKIAIDVAGHNYNQGRVNALVIIAPKGAHWNWVLNEVPKHLPDYVPRTVAVLDNNKSKRRKAQLDALFTAEGTLRVLAINIETISGNAKAQAWVKKFLDATNAMLVVDESQFIKTPGTARTRACLKLRDHAKLRRVLTGTPMPNGALDLFSQLLFLGDEYCPTPTFAAFKARYCEMLPEDHYLVQHIRKKQADKMGVRVDQLKFDTQIPAKDDKGVPLVRNEAELKAWLAKVSYVALKAECLDLPEKIYVKRPIEMSAVQAEAYNALVRGIKAGQFAGRQLTKVAALCYLQQLRGGFRNGHLIPCDDPLEVPDGIPFFADPMDNPVVQDLLEFVAENIERGKIIVWAAYRQELAMLVDVLRSVHGHKTVVHYYGATNDAERLVATERIAKDDTCRIMIANPASAGRSHTWTKVASVYYYSNTFNGEHRSQSEDRNHRHGLETDRPVYADGVVIGTNDDRILEALKGKQSLSSDMLGKGVFRDWLTEIET